VSEKDFVLWEDEEDGWEGGAGGGLVVAEKRGREEMGGGGEKEKDWSFVSSVLQYPVSFLLRFCYVLVSIVVEFWIQKRARVRIQNKNDNSGWSSNIIFAIHPLIRSSSTLFSFALLLVHPSSSSTYLSFGIFHHPIPSNNVIGFPSPPFAHPTSISRLSSTLAIPSLAATTIGHSATRKQNK
jgi:hypothetical protein